MTKAEESQAQKKTYWKWPIETMFSDWVSDVLLNSFESFWAIERDKFLMLPNAFTRTRIKCTVADLWMGLSSIGSNGIRLTNIKFAL